MGVLCSWRIPIKIHMRNTPSKVRNTSNRIIRNPSTIHLFRMLLMGCHSVCVGQLFGSGFFQPGDRLLVDLFFMGIVRLQRDFFRYQELNEWIRLLLLVCDLR